MIFRILPTNLKSVYGIVFSFTFCIGVIFFLFFYFVQSHFSRDFKTFLQMTSHKKIVQFWMYNLHFNDVQKQCLVLNHFTAKNPENISHAPSNITQSQYHERFSSISTYSLHRVHNY